MQNVHLRRFRRSFADSWLAAGGSTDELIHITGWKTSDMVREYAEARSIARPQGPPEPSPGGCI